MQRLGGIADDTTQHRWYLINHVPRAAIGQQCLSVSKQQQVIRRHWQHGSSFVSFARHHAQAAMPLYPEGCLLLQLRDGDQLAMMEEMRAMSMVAHPHVLCPEGPIALLECTTSGRWGMAMRWAEHGCLGDVLRCVSPLALTLWCSRSWAAAQVQPKEGSSAEAHLGFRV